MEQNYYMSYKLVAANYDTDIRHHQKSGIPCNHKESFEVIWGRTVNIIGFLEHCEERLSPTFIFIHHFFEITMAIQYEPVWIKRYFFQCVSLTVKPQPS